MSAGKAKERDEAVRAAFDQALKDYRPKKRTANEVTSDRFGDFLDKYGEKLTGEQRDAVALVRHLLETHDASSAGES